jgi:hypothetical protein
MPSAFIGGTGFGAMRFAIAQAELSTPRTTITQKLRFMTAIMRQSKPA